MVLEHEVPAAFAQNQEEEEETTRYLVPKTENQRSLLLATPWGKDQQGPLLDNQFPPAERREAKQILEHAQRSQEGAGQQATRRMRPAEQ